MSVPKSTVTTTGHYQAPVKDSLIFDTHEYVKRMTDGGFNEQQAETLAAEQADLLGNLATRQDIEAVQADLQVVKGGLEVVRDDLEVVKQNMATKEDLKNMAVKYNLENMATKEDLENMAVKYNLENMATKDDLENFATKQDLEIVRKEIALSAQTLMAIMKQDKFDMMKLMAGYFFSGLAVMAAMMTALAAVLKLT